MLTEFDVLQKPPPDTDERGWFRWFYRVGEILNGKLWDDVYPTSVTTGVGGTAPSMTAYRPGGNLKAYEFTGAVSNKEMQIGYQLPHPYLEQSTVVPHLHLHINNNGVGGTVIFDMIHEWSNVNQTGAIAETTTRATITLPADSNVYDNYILSFGNILGTGMRISSLFMTQIKRMQSVDTFAGSVWLKSADIHAQRSLWGSWKEFTKS